LLFPKAQILREGGTRHRRARFDLRRLAEQWAEEEREHIEKGSV
jgi:hypothetical protein